MIRIFTFILIISLFSQCASIQEAPEFRGIEKLQVSKLKGKTADLNADAVFYNPNKRGMTLKKVTIDVKTEDRIIGQINKSLNLKIKPESDFKVPLDATVNIGDIGVIRGLISMFGGKEIEITYSGEIKVSVYGIPRKLYIDQTEKLQF